MYYGPGVRMANDVILLDGRRAVKVFSTRRAGKSAATFQEFLNEWLTGGPDDPSGLITELSAWAKVPWVYRAVDVRAMAVASMPRSLMKGDTDVTDTPEGKRIMSGMRRRLQLTEAALCLFGASYWLKEGNAFGKNITPRWVVTSSMSIEEDPVQGLTGFKRRVGAIETTWPVDKVVYFWLPAMQKEVGPGPSPVVAALSAAGVLRNLNLFAEGYFKRGAIMPTLLTVSDPDATDTELRGLEAWWKRLVGGISKSWETVAVRAEVKPVVIGGNVKDSAAPELTDKKREDVATAMGIPQTLLFSQAANYATGHEDVLGFYNRTVIPECDLIAESVNEQWLDPLGYRLQFNPDELPIMQADEAERAASLYQLTQAGMPLEFAMDQLGYELNKEDRARLFPVEKPAVPVAPAGTLAAPGGEGTTESPAGGVNPFLPQPVVEDLRRWLRKAAKKGGPVDFQSDVIPAPIHERLAGALEAATDAADVRAVFAPFLSGKIDLFKPEGDDPVLPVGPVKITEKQIDEAIAEFDRVFPEFAGLLEAEVVG